MRMKLPRNMAMVRISRVTLMCLTRIIPMTSLRRRLMRKMSLKRPTVRSPRLTGKTRRNVFPVSDRYSVIVMRWKQTERMRSRIEEHLIRLMVKTRNLKSSLASEIPASMRMMRQISTGEEALAAHDSTMTTTLNTMTSTPMMRMRMS